MISMRGKTVFITGASAGIGWACAEAFAVIGAKLILTARRVDRLKDLSDKLKEKYSTDLLFFKFDVRNRREAEKLIDSLPDNFKNIDVLVNNAGLALGTDKIQDGNPEQWDILIDTNIKGLLYISKAIIPCMVERGSGHVINISSIAGHQVYAGGNIYCATKYAVDAITKAMQIDLVDTQIRVTAISPGMVETEFSLVRFEGDSEKAKNVYKGIQVLTPEDVADAVVYCATRPLHVNINDLIIMSTNQASTYAIHKEV